MANRRFDLWLVFIERVVLCLSHSFRYQEKEISVFVRHYFQLHRYRLQAESAEFITGKTTCALTSLKC